MSFSKFVNKIAHRKNLRKNGSTRQVNKDFLLKKNCS